MIEFKAECGHTVRAKDEDAGGVVRCTYCGRQAAVPDSRADGLDFLFNDVVQPEEATEGRRGRRRRRRDRASKSGGPRRFDPFSIILRMCYAALLLIVVIVVGRKYVLPLFEDGGVTKRVAPNVAQRRPPSPPAEQRAPAPTNRRNGLLSEGTFMGLYVMSAPEGATVHVVEESKAPASGRVDAVAGAVAGRGVGEFLRVPDGGYVVDVVLPWSDPQLNDPSLPNYNNYRSFRRRLEEATEEDRRKLLEDYFVPDEAASVFLDQTPEQIYIVRQFRGVAVQGGKSKGVRALFLPKIHAPGHAAFAVAPLVTHYIPKREMYGFNEDHVRNELDFWEVPAADRLFVMEALKRLGIIPYVTPDGRTRLFKIGIEEGQFASKVIREATP